MTVLLVGGASFGAYSVLAPVIAKVTASKDFTGDGTGTARVSIPEGASGRTIGQVLELAGVVKSGKAFVDAAAENARSGSIQPGEYVLRRQMSAKSALTMLLDPTARRTDGVTIREGLRQGEVLAALAKATDNKVADYTAALKDPAGLGLPPAAKGRAEGWLFPDTYAFRPGSSAQQQLATMVARTQDVLAALGVDDSRAQRLLTEASIVQAEGGSETDFGKIARVIDNRLANKLGNGARLQMDSTVAYGTGKRGIFTTSAERADLNNRYNTYARPGLPVGPIGNPGKAAITATLRPTTGNWLYFVVVNLDTGETKFSTTLAEHSRYTQQFQEWYRKNRPS